MSVFHLWKGPWRKKWILDSTPRPQLHKRLIESWNLCLNLCSHKWLTPSLMSCNKFDSFWIMTVVGRIWIWSYEFKNLFFKFSKTRSSLEGWMVIPFNISWWEKRVFEKSYVFCIGKRNIIHIYCSYGVISTGMMLERY